MKLESLLTAAVALTLSTGLNAQDPDQDVSQHQQAGSQISLSHGLDASGVDFQVEDAFAEGYIALLVSPYQGSWTLSGSFDGVEIGMGQPKVFALDNSSEDYHVALDLDIGTLAEFGTTVYVQAVAIGGSDHSDGDAPLDIRLSNVLRIDFAAELAANLALQAELRSRGQDDIEHDADRDGSEHQACRCTQSDIESEGGDR